MILSKMMTHIGKPICRSELLIYNNLFNRNCDAGGLNYWTQLIASGKVRGLAVTSGKRVRALPDVPTVAEAAGLPDFASAGWQGWFMPAGTPTTVVARIRDEVVRVALNREEGVRIKDIATDFGITESCLNNWLAQARDDAQTPEARSESVELREARKRIRLLEQENEVLRRAAAYLGQANLPKG